MNKKHGKKITRDPKKTGGVHTHETTTRNTQKMTEL